MRALGTKLLDTSILFAMNDRRRVTASLVFLYQSECMPTIPKFRTGIEQFCAVADFPKGHLQMLISEPRSDKEWNCKTSRRPAFRDGPPFLAILR